MFLALTAPPARLAPPFRHLAQEAASLRPIVRAVIAGIVREPPGHPDVEDATNETLRRAIEKPDALREARAVRAWVLGIARHVALDVLRSRKRARQHDEVVEEPGSQRTGVELVDGGPDPFERVAEARRTEMIKKAFLKLPEGQRKALVMFHLEGLEYQEIAARLEVPLGTVATWVSRGRRAMATTLGEENGA
jgi:RNA polymerase sigma-70 factor (ECF subfamily)